MDPSLPAFRSMNDQPTALGIASRYSDHRLRITFVVVSPAGPTLTVLDSWQGTRQSDLPSQLADIYQIIRNRFDPVRPQALAVKRAESPVRRPPDHYDARTSFEGVAMLAAEHLGCRHFDYRTGELKRLLDAPDVLAVTREKFPACPEGDEAVEAAAAACAALGELGHQI
jgi:hypothetical protein